MSFLTIMAVVRNSPAPHAAHDAPALWNPALHSLRITGHGHPTTPGRQKGKTYHGHVELPAATTAWMYVDETGLLAHAEAQDVATPTPALYLPTGQSVHTLGHV